MDDLKGEAVIGQDTGFGQVLLTGGDLVAFQTTDEISGALKLLLGQAR